jgi:hypothetical protein
MESTEPEMIQDWTSGDGQWQAQVIGYDCVAVDETGLESAYEVLEVTNVESGEGQVVATQLRSCEGIGAFGLYLVQWGEAALYYTDAREGVPDGGGYWLPPVYRIAMSDMSIAPLGNGVFSMTRDFYAAWSWDEQTLTLWDINEGEQVATFDAQMPDAPLAELLWLPDESGLLYIQVDSLYPPTHSYVVHVDLETSEQSLLLETKSGE